MTVAMRLARLRVRAQLTQGQIARRRGCSQAYVSMVEAGRRAPTADLVLLYLERCGASEAEWAEMMQAVVLEQAARRRRPPQGGRDND